MAAPSDVISLVQMANDLDISLTEGRAVQLLHFLDLMLEKNAAVNLTAIRDREKGVVLHLLDSLLFMKGMGLAGQGGSEGGCSFEGSFVDMGCGGGFPGIPLALVNERLSGTLCDSVKKKISAVEEFIGALGLGERLRTSSERLELLPLEPEHKARYDFAFARALAPLPVLVEYAAPLLRKGGHLVVSKGVPEQDELDSGLRAAKVAGMKHIGTMELELPMGYGHRTVLVYGKIASPSVRLPRMVGYALKHPLA